MRSMNNLFVLFFLFLLLSACRSGDGWQRSPPDFDYDESSVIHNPVFSGIMQGKVEEVIQVLDKQGFIQIDHAQIAEYCRDCYFPESDTPLEGCKKSDRVYLVRSLSAENTQGGLVFYQVRAALYSIYYPREFFLGVVKNPFLICLDFELTDVYAQVK